MPEIFMEYNGEGGHRLVVDGERSDWRMYEYPIEFKGYMSFTQYWSDNEHPLERIIKVKDVKASKAPVSVCRECGQPDGWNGESFGPDACVHQREKFPTLTFRSA